MSEHKDPAPAKPAGESLLHEVAEGVLDVAAWETIRSVVWKILKQIWKLITEGALGGAKQATAEVIANKIKKPFKEIRAEVYSYIDTVIRQASGNEKTDAFFAHLERRRKRGAYPYDATKEYGPMDEYKGWAVLMSFYSSLQEPEEENQRKEVLRRIVEAGPTAFDNFVEDLTHDVLHQAWTGIAEATAPFRAKLKVLWQVANNKVRTAMILFVGLPLWLIMGVMLMGSLHHTWAVVAAIFAIIFVALWGGITFLENRRSRQTRTDESTRLPFWRSAFGWGAFGLLPVIFLIGISHDTSFFELSYLVPWSMGIVFAVGIFWLIFGNQPIYALALHYIGEWPKYGKPVRRLVRNFGGAVAVNLAFAFFLPFAHLEQHTLTAIGLILMIATLLWAIYAELHVLRKVFASLIALVFIRGIVTSGKEMHEIFSTSDKAAEIAFKEKDGFKKNYPALARIARALTPKKAPKQKVAEAQPTGNPVVVHEDTAFNAIRVVVPPGGRKTAWEGPTVPFDKILIDYDTSMLGVMTRWDEYEDGSYGPESGVRLDYKPTEKPIRLQFANNGKAPTVVTIRYRPI